MNASRTVAVLSVAALLVVTACTPDDGGEQAADAGSDLGADADAGSTDADAQQDATDDPERPDYQYQVDPRHPCTVETFVDDEGASFLLKSVTYTFNEAGEVATATGETAEGVDGTEYQTSYEYDSMGRQTTTVTEQTSPRQHVTVAAFSYRDQTSLIDEIAYTRGSTVDQQEPLQTAVFHYNANDQVDRIEYVAPDDSLYAETSYAVSEDSRVLRLETRTPQDELSSSTEYRFDENFLISEKTTTSYRQDGDVVQRDEFTYDESGWWSSTNLFQNGEPLGTQDVGYGCHE